MTEYCQPEGPDNFRLRISISALLCGMFLLLGIPQVEAATLEGMIFSPGGPVAESAVYAYPDYPSLVSDTNGITSVPGEKPGQFKMNVPPGSYYLIARGRKDGIHFFSYHGVNPITLGEGYQWLPFFLVKENPLSCSQGLGRGITGKVYYKDQTLDQGVVSVYQLQDSKFRGMGLLTNTVDESGSFSFELEPGSYVVIARKKKAERGIGPVSRGDLFCYPSANPITINADQLCEIRINCYPRDDLDLFLDQDAVNPQGRRHDERRQASLWELQPETAQTSNSPVPAIISGTVRDLDGEPRPGLIVTAYPAMGIDLFQMHIVRLITDTMGKTDAEGHYRIELPLGGRYYLVARKKVGEAPDRFEYYGLYEGNANHSIYINSGETRSNVNLVVEKIMPESDLAVRLRDQ